MWFPMEIRRVLGKITLQQETVGLSGAGVWMSADLVLKIEPLSRESACAADMMTFSALLPAWSWALIGNLWIIVIAPFYLPNYKCMELGYFETAKSTSGVGLRQEPTDSI